MQVNLLPKTPRDQTFITVNTNFITKMGQRCADQSFHICFLFDIFKQEWKYKNIKAKQRFFSHFSVKIRIKVRKIS